MQNNRSKEEIREIVASSLSIAEVCRKMGIKPAGGNYKVVNSLIKKYNIDISHFTGGAWNQGLRYRQIKKARPLDEILVENSEYQSYKLKLRLIDSGYKECVCENCNRTEWEGQPIPLELHHINGDKFDNRIENLQLLCPNCHALTENYRGKSKKQYSIKETNNFILLNEEEQIERENKRNHRNSNKIYTKEMKLNKCIVCGKETKNKTFCCEKCCHTYLGRNKATKETLLELSKQVHSLSELKRLINKELCDNTIKKWCKEYGIYDEIKANFIPKTFPILQYDLNNNFIREWKCGDDIVNELGYNKSNIQLCCRNKKPQYNGFKWKYKEILT